MHKMTEIPNLDVKSQIIHNFCNKTWISRRQSFAKLQDFLALKVLCFAESKVTISRCHQIYRSCSRRVIRLACSLEVVTNCLLKVHQHFSFPTIVHDSLIYDFFTTIRNYTDSIFCYVFEQNTLERRERLGIVFLEQNEKFDDLESCLYPLFSHIPSNNNVRARHIERAL